MSDNNDTRPPAPAAGANPEPGSAEPTPRKQRRRLPVRARLSLDDMLAANDHHPLGSSVPEVRAANRVRLIAAVLARLAQTDLARRA